MFCVVRTYVCCDHTNILVIFLEELITRFTVFFYSSLPIKVNKPYSSQMSANNSAKPSTISYDTNNLSYGATNRDRTSDMIPTTFHIREYISQSSQIRFFFTTMPPSPTNAELQEELDRMRNIIGQYRQKEIETADLLLKNDTLC